MLSPTNPTNMSNDTPVTRFTQRMMCVLRRMSWHSVTQAKPAHLLWALCMLLPGISIALFTDEVESALFLLTVVLQKLLQCMFEERVEFSVPLDTL